MQQALRKWNEEEDKSVEKAEILEYLAFSLYAQGNMRRALREGIDISKRCGIQATFPIGVALLPS